MGLVGERRCEDEDDGGSVWKTLILNTLDTTI